MIQKTVSFTTSDGALHATVELAQAHELEKFLKEKLATSEASDLALLLLKNKEAIVDLLTMKANSRPKARKTNGAIRKKTTKTDTQQPPLV